MLSSLVLSLALVVGCGQPPQPIAPVQAPGAEAHVLVVRNTNSITASRIANYYIKRRNIPQANVVDISVLPTEEIPESDYRTKIEQPVKSYIQAVHLGDQIDYIVLTKGIPLRIKEGGYAVDQFLATMDMNLEPIKDQKVESFQRVLSPYFSKKEHFSKKKYGFYLVTRLDGYSDEDAMKLVDHSLAAKPNKGPFLIDEDPRRSGPGYQMLNDAATRCAAILKTRGMDVQLDETKTFIGFKQDLAGYWSWGSNDYSFNKDGYKALTFQPGAIAETAVSTSGRTFWPTQGGQSLIADLIAGGVTGVKGYVHEPYSIALCQPDLLFDRYTSGYNLAESFYMATPFLKWKDIVVGDPLCNPYAK